jgi:hypothetical protein
MVGELIIGCAGLAWILYFHPEWIVNHWFHWLGLRERN